MVAMPTPFEAYRLDLGRLGVDEDLCAADSMWLLIAHCLTRFADQPETARLDLAQRCAQALEQFAATAHEADDDIAPLDDASLGELNSLVAGLQNFGDRSGQEQVAKVVLDLSTRMAGLGAYMLAHTMVGHARGAVHLVSDRTRGLMLAEQARVMRLLGQLDDAEVLYAQLHAIGERGCDELLLARAAIGRGVVARVRGNYPKARQFFADALDLSERAKSHELQRLAHQGLTIAAAVAEQWDEALRHGWLTLVHGAGNAEQEAEALGNLAHISLGAGYPRAALHAVLKAIPSYSDERSLLPALGTAVVAAARCDERSLLDHLAHRLEAAANHTRLPYEGARALLSLAQAFDEIGLAAQADAVRDRARGVATEHDFHELIHVAERDELTRRAVTLKARELDQ
jgi:tetratricopeptide (TPR) repeat protein